MQRANHIDKPAFSVSLCLNPNYGWKSRSGIHCRDHGCIGEQLAAYNHDSSFLKQVPEIFRKADDLSGGILEADTFVLAWADHIRSYPAFYALVDNTLFIGNDARMVRDKAGCREASRDSAVEFAMSGFVAGRNTLYNNLYCLNPGEYLVWDKQNGELSVQCYYQYNPRPEKTAPLEEYYEKFNDILNGIVRKIISRHNGSPFVFPLSAGLDSRLLLCKFHELGCENITTFSYGPSFNFESRHAERIAQHLGVRWKFIRIPAKEHRRMFENDTRRQYWEYADGLKAVPSMREYSALKYIYDHELVPKDSLMINGQSGDYISGGHISLQWQNTSERVNNGELLKVLYNKHYDLWRMLKTPDNFESIKHRIAEVLPLSSHVHSGEYWAISEDICEYYGRQTCLVLLGQRSYEFFGYNWELPLWEKELVDFFEKLPLEMKYSQKFYKSYLQRYNYQNLFAVKEPNIWRWPAPMLWSIPAAQIIGRLAGRQAKKNFYARLRYFGHYANQYSFFPLKLHLQTATQTRNIFSLYVRRWIQENDYPIPEILKKEMFL